MKKLLFVVLLLFCSNVINGQNVIRNGGTFKVEKSRKQTRTDTLITNYTFQDSRNDTYPIIINKNTGRCYIWRISLRRNKPYKMYMKKDICLAICEELGITYKEGTNVKQ